MTDEYLPASEAEDGPLGDLTQSEMVAALEQAFQCDNDEDIVIQIEGAADPE